MLKGNCLIVGGSSDIGIELSKKLMNKNIDTILTYSSKNGMQKIKNVINRNITLRYLNFSILDSVYDFLSNIEDDIFYLVDLSHTNIEELFASIKDEDIISYFNTNITNRTIFLKYIVKKMLLNRKGRLIYISSTAVSIPNKGQGLYAASKCAIEKIYKIIGIEMYKKGISTVILRPGYIASGRSEEFLKNRWDKLKNYILSPSDIADSIVFFLEDNGRCFNAREITLDRGLFSSKKEYLWI